MENEEEDANLRRILEDSAKVLRAAYAAGIIDKDSIGIEAVSNGVAFEDDIFTATFLWLVAEAKEVVDNQDKDKARRLFTLAKNKLKGIEQVAIESYLNLNFGDPKVHKVDFKAVDMVEAALEQTTKTIVSERVKE